MPSLAIGSALLPRTSNPASESGHLGSDACDTCRLQEAMMQVVQAHGPMAMPVVGTVCGPMPMVCQAPVVPRLNSVTWRNRPA